VDEHRVEQIMAMMLRVGVLLAAGVILAGGAVYLWRHGFEQPSYASFHGVSDHLKHPSSISRSAIGGGGRALIQLGLLLLIATPVLRVGFSVLAFERQRDWTYVWITVFVLAVLVFSLFGGEELK
jgi:uncharacterized membrane protein